MALDIDPEIYRTYLQEQLACVEDLAGDLLIRILDGHDAPAAEIRGLVEKIGLPWGTVRRLKKRFGIESIREGGTWWWRLPPASEDEDPLLTMMRVATAEDWVEKRAAYRRGMPLEELHRRQ